MHTSGTDTAIEGKHEGSITHVLAQLQLSVTFVASVADMACCTVALEISPLLLQEGPKEFDKQAIF